MARLYAILLSLILLISCHLKSNAQNQFNNLIKLETSEIRFTIHDQSGPLYTYRTLYMLLGISYERTFKKNWVLGGSFSLWSDQFSGNPFNITYEYLPFDTSHIIGTIVGRDRFRYVDIYGGYKLHLIKRIDQYLIVLAGITKCWGYDYYATSYDIGPDVYILNTISRHESFNGPFLRTAFDINIFKKRLNMGVHFNLREYKQIGWEYNYGFHTGVNF